MPINILMPALSPTMEKGNLAKWLKKEGDKVKSGDVIAEIETDKATMEVEAVDEGTLARIVVPEGTQDVPVNELIAVLAGDGEDVKAAGASAGSAKSAAAPAKAEAPKEEAPKQDAKKEQAPAPQAKPADAPKPAAAPAPQAAAPASQANGHGRIFSSPLARRLAKDAGIEIGRINGSGSAWPHHRPRCRGGEVRQGPQGTGCRASAGKAPTRSRRRCRTSRSWRCSSREATTSFRCMTACARNRSRSASTKPRSRPSRTSISRSIASIGRAAGRPARQINAAAPKDKDGEAGSTRSRSMISSSRRSAVALQRDPGLQRRAGLKAAMHQAQARLDVGVAVAMPGGLDHADHPQGRREDAVRHLERDEGLRRPRQGPQAEAPGI